MFNRNLHIGIADLKNLLFGIKRHYGLDFSNYALSSLKWRVENFIDRFHFKDIDELLHKLIKDDYFYQLFLKDILVDTSELFRDPEFWIELRRTVLFKFRKFDHVKILLPECNSGEELYSILIMLKIEGLIDKAEIAVTSLSALNVERMQNAIVETKKMELNIANFEKVYPSGNILNFFEDKGRSFKLNTELLSNVKIFRHNLFADELSGMQHLILFRNKTIYYNPQLKIKALTILKEHLITGGFIALGVKENLEYPDSNNSFLIISDTEKIYKKTL